MPHSLKIRPSPVYNYDDYSKVLKFKLQEAHRIARENLLAAKHKSKENFDKKVNDQTFKVGDFVRVKNKRKKGKLDMLWSEPFEVVKINSNNNVTIKKGNKMTRIHNNLLKLSK